VNQQWKNKQKENEDEHFANGAAHACWWTGDANRNMAAQGANAQCRRVSQHD
jgi:hypothetical protein